MSKRKVPPEDFFAHTKVYLCKRSRQIVTEQMLRRPYYGTRQDKELKNAKDRARAD